MEYGQIGGPMEMKDLNSYEMNERFYGGNAGAKVGIWYESENWIIKYPQSAKALAKAQLSYTTSPLSEHLGSMVYGIIGIPVHETFLGVRDGRVVVACKDFLKPGENLIEFKQIKNAYLPSDGRDGTSGSGNGTMLSDVLDAVKNAPVLSRMPEALDRFWDMFVVDFLIGNNDRNNTNWGLINDIKEKKRLSPVFDNGNAFYGKRNDETLNKRMESEESLRTDALSVFTNAYLDDEGHHIHPHRVMLEHSFKGLDEALVRLYPRVDLGRIESVIDAVPARFMGLEVLSDVRRSFYQKMVAIKAREVLEPAYREAVAGVS
jgi:hypothetical protein